MTIESIITKGIETLEQLKKQHKLLWEAGSYIDFAKYMEAGAIEILDTWSLQPNTKLLDVACGAGQTAIPAAKLGVNVTGVDIAENLIEHANKRARKGNLNVKFDVGDAESLAYENDEFDTVLSMIGAMFAPHPEKVVSEMARVLKPGGRLLMANWTSTSMPAEMFKCIGSYLPPSNGTPPILWGDEQTVIKRLSPYFTDIKLSRKIYPHWHYPLNANELVTLFKQFFGPVVSAYQQLDVNQHKELDKNLADIYRQNSKEDNGILTITTGEYLEVIATRK